MPALQLEIDDLGAGEASPFAAERKNSERHVFC